MLDHGETYSGTPDFSAQSTTPRTIILSRSNPTAPPRPSLATLLRKSHEEGAKRKAYVIGTPTPATAGTKQSIFQREKKASKGVKSFEATTGAAPLASTPLGTTSSTTTSTQTPPSPAPPNNLNQSSQPSPYLSSLLHALPYTSTGVGMLLAHFPSMLLIRVFGAKRVISISLLISAVATALLPSVLDQKEEWEWAVWIMQLVLGMCFAPALSLIGETALNWGGVKEQLVFVVAGFVAIQVDF